MIGLGNWTANIKMIVYTGPIGINISDDNGEYKVDFVLPEKFSQFKIETYDIVEEGNKLSGKGRLNLGGGTDIKLAKIIAGKELFAEVEFNGDEMQGVLKIPFLKREIPITDGKRI